MKNIVEKSPKETTIEMVENMENYLMTTTRRAINVRISFLGVESFNDGDKYQHAQRHDQSYKPSQYTSTEMMGPSKIIGNAAGDRVEVESMTENTGENDELIQVNDKEVQEKVE